MCNSYLQKLNIILFYCAVIYPVWKESDNFHLLLLWFILCPWMSTKSYCSFFCYPKEYDRNEKFKATLNLKPISILYSLHCTLYFPLVPNSGHLSEGKNLCGLWPQSLLNSCQKGEYYHFPGPKDFLLRRICSVYSVPT